MFTFALFIIGGLLVGLGLLAILIARSGGRRAPQDHPQGQQRSDWTDWQDARNPEAGGGTGGVVAGGAALLAGVVALGWGGFNVISGGDESGSLVAQQLQGREDDAEVEAQGADSAIMNEAEVDEDAAGDAEAGPTTTETVTESPVPTTIAARQDSRPTNDLGLSVPMTEPACDGRGIVVLHSAVGNHETEIGDALAANPGASYLRTDQSCPSLRNRDESGNVIYAVYRLSGYTHSEVCADVAAAGGSAYGRWLDDTSDPNELIRC